MKRWALLVVVLYAVALCVLAWPLLVAAFGTEAAFNAVMDIRFWTWVWIVAASFALLQAAMLVVPVRIAAQRPVTKRWIFWPILATVLAILLLAGVMLTSVWMVMDETKAQGEWWWVLIAIGAFWLVWTFIFGFYSGIASPQTFMSRLAKMLVASSIIELLVAIPAHVIARVRSTCCAQWGTFAGLALGLAIAVLAFGPAVFMLIVRRYASLKPPEHLPAETPDHSAQPPEKKDA
jgi:hypothetical protein